MRREREVGGNWEAALRLDHSRWHWRAMPGSMFCAHRNLKGRDSLAAGEATYKCENDIYYVKERGEHANTYPASRGYIHGS